MSADGTITEFPPGTDPRQLQIVPAKTEVEIAADLRNHARAHLDLLVELMNKAERLHGMRLGFSFARDGFGRNVVGGLEIVKVI